MNTKNNNNHNNRFNIFDFDFYLLKYVEIQWINVFIYIFNLQFVFIEKKDEKIAMQYEKQ